MIDKFSRFKDVSKQQSKSSKLDVFNMAPEKIEEIRRKIDSLFE